LIAAESIIVELKGAIRLMGALNEAETDE